MTNFTSLTTVDYPLVLISGCVDNYSDQVYTLDFCPTQVRSSGSVSSQSFLKFLFVFANIGDDQTEF